VTSESKKDAPSADCGFPDFARGFPRDPALDELVAAFAAGDYARVREGGEALARDASASDVKEAARLLVERTRPDPTAKLLFLFAAALLVFLTVWWITHDGPSNDRPLPATKPAVEYVN
jgi:hypothetical protein